MRISSTSLPPVYTEFYRANLFDAFFRILVSFYLGYCIESFTNPKHFGELFYPFRAQSVHKVESFINIEI